jgi:hypothetical protein
VIALAASDHDSYGDYTSSGSCQAAPQGLTGPSLRPRDFLKTFREKLASFVKNGMLRARSHQPGTGRLQDGRPRRSNRRKGVVRMQLLRAPDRVERLVEVSTLHGDLRQQRVCVGVVWIEPYRVPDRCKSVVVFSDRTRGAPYRPQGSIDPDRRGGSRCGPRARPKKSGTDPRFPKRRRAVPGGSGTAPRATMDLPSRHGP